MKKDLLRSLPRDLWYSIRDFLQPTDVENMLDTASALWKCIFKNNSWLDKATTYDRCAPVLISHQLSSFRPRKSSNDLYFALLASDYSGDLRYCQQEFFDSLQDNWTYDEDNYEIRFPSGITVNVYEVMTGADVTVLPLRRIFSNNKGGPFSEYCFYMSLERKMTIKTLESSDVFGLGGMARKWRAIKYGCAIRLSYEEQIKQYVIFPRGPQETKIQIDRCDKATGFIESYTKAVYGLTHH